MQPSFATALLNRLPPWWRRLVGAPIVRGLAGPIDDMAKDTADSIKLRFPVQNGDQDALALIGKERRILRGPNEAGNTYAARLNEWLDDHKTRGGPYALARQLYLFWKDSLGVPFQIVYWSGRRYSVDTAGAITRDDISWTNPNGTGHWSEFWIFYDVSGLAADWITEDGSGVIDDAGEQIIFDVLSGGALTPDDVENFSSVPREWSAAHIAKIHVVLVYGNARLWGYPVPVKKWGADWGVWQTNDTARVEITD